MKIFRHLLLVTVFFAMPVMASAGESDENISSAEITSAGAGQTRELESYTISMTPTTLFAAGDIITMFAQEYPNGVPFESGFDFGDTYELSPGCSVSGASYMDGAGYRFTFEGDVSTNCLVGLGDVMNSDADGCYTFLFTTDSDPGESSSYTALDEPFELGAGDCTAAEEGDGGDTSSLSVQATVFGENIGLNWEAVDGASDYGVWYSPVSEADARDTDSTTNGSAIVTATQTTVENLDPKTTYYLFVDANDGEGGEPLDSSDTLTQVTEKKISNQKATKPTIPKKKRKKKKLTVKWSAPDAVKYVKKYKMKVYKKKGKKWNNVKTYKKIKDTKTQKVVKGLKPGKTYKVRMKVVYDTDDVTKWSKYSKTRKTKK